jgi:MFS family permease
MRADLSWTYTQAGWVNTANALGYLLGAIAMTALVSRARPDRLFAAGMLTTAASVFACGLLRGYGALLALRFVAGIGGACAFIAGAALVAELFARHPERSAAGISIYFGGGGLGILLSGAALPWWFELRGPRAWDEAWLALGALSGALCVPSLLASALVPARPLAAAHARWRKGPLLPSLAGYFLFAVGSIVYMTFIVAWMRDRGAGAATVSAVWGVLGFSIMAAPFAWRPALERWRGGWPLAASIAGCAAGAALPLVSAAPAAMVVSAALFGSAFFVPPAAVTEIARRLLPREAWGSAIATYTVAFAAGQPIGPPVAGAIADATGTLFAGLLASVLILALAAAAAACQRT